MDYAYSASLNDFVLADSLVNWQETVKTHQFYCPNELCGCPVHPHSWERGKKLRPSFHAYEVPGHLKGCIHDRSAGGRRKFQTVLEGAPPVCPNRLVLPEVKERPPERVLLKRDQPRPTGPKMVRQRSQDHHSNALAKIVYWYVTNPNSGHQRLEAPGCTGRTYSSVFDHIRSSEGGRHSDTRIYITRLDRERFYTRKKNGIAVHISIQPLYKSKGDKWRNGKVVIDTTAMSTYEIGSIIRWFELIKAEHRSGLFSRTTTRRSTNAYAYVAFLGTPCENDPSVFTCEDHRLICGFIFGFLKLDIPYPPRSFVMKQAEKSAVSGEESITIRQVAQQPRVEEILEYEPLEQNRGEDRAIDKHEELPSFKVEQPSLGVQRAPAATKQRPMTGPVGSRSGTLQLVQTPRGLLSRIKSLLSFW